MTEIIKGKPKEEKLEEESKTTKKSKALSKIPEEKEEIVKEKGPSSSKTKVMGEL